MATWPVHTAWVLAVMKASPCSPRRPADTHMVECAIGTRSKCSEVHLLSYRGVPTGRGQVQRGAVPCSRGRLRSHQVPEKWLWRFWQELFPVFLL